jgi:hypothetical protein
LILGNLSKENILSEESKHIFEKFCGTARIIAANLFSSSTPITTTEKMGLFFTIVSFGVILSPISLSDTDPYHIKGIFEEVKKSIPLLEDLSKNQEIQSTLIVHLKFSQQSHLDATEKIILGKYRTSTS